MASLTHSKKAALLKKVDESIGPIGPYRYRLHDAIRGGVLVDAVYLLLKLHNETVKREAEEIEELRRQLANAEADIADYQKADEVNHELYRERGAVITELQQQLAEANAEIRALNRECHNLVTEDAHEALQDYIAFHRDDTQHIMRLSEENRELKRQLAEAREAKDSMRRAAVELQDVVEEDSQAACDWRDKAHQLTAEVKDLKRQVAERNATIEEIQAELSELRPALASAQAELDTERHRGNYLHVELDHARMHLEQAQEDNGYLNRSIADLRKAVEEHRKAAVDWREKAYKMVRDDHKKLVFGVALHGLPAEYEEDE